MRCRTAPFLSLRRWGYTHLGQILEVDSSTLLGQQVADGSKVSATSPHNLEVSLLCALGSCGRLGTCL